MTITHINWKVKSDPWSCSAYLFCMGLMTLEQHEQTAELGGVALSWSDTDLMTTDIFGPYCMSHNCSQTKAILLTTEIAICGLVFAGISIQEYKGIRDKFSKVPYEIAIVDSLKIVEYQQVHMA